MRYGSITGSFQANTLSGSLTKLANGSSYLVAGNNVTVVSSSSGQVTISSTASGGPSYFESTTAGSTYTTGSVAFRGSNASIDSPADVGPNVFFFVSGTKGSLGSAGVDDAVFGGNAVVSGTLKVGSVLEVAGLPGIVTYLDSKNFLNIAAGGGGVDINDAGNIRLLSPGVKIGSNFFNVPVGSDTSFFVSGTLSGRGTSGGSVSTFGGQLVSSGTVHALGGISGSLTTLADGTSYVIAGNNITVTSGANGALTLTAKPAGSNTQVQFNNSNAFGASSNFTYDSSENSLGAVNVATTALTASSVMAGASTVNLFNTTATTVNFGGAATSLSVGNSGGTTTFNGIITGSNDLVATAGSAYFSRVKEKFNAKADTGTTQTYDCATGHVFYHSGMNNNFTANFTNLSMSSGYASSVTLVLSQSATPYIPTAVQIGGVGQQLNWQGSSQPSGTANKKDVVSFSILNSSGSYVVLGQLVTFG